MYQIQNISFSLGNKTILQNLSLCIRPGKFTAVLGPNGAGKSTLLRILSGEVSKYQNSVELNGKKLAVYSHRELALQRAVLSQSIIVHFPYTAKEIVLLGCLLHRYSRQRKEHLAEQQLEEVGMLNHQDRIYLSLSGGEQQRVQLARVMAQISPPYVSYRYLLLDEPTASLDIASQHLIFSRVKDLCKAGVGILAIIHDLNLAAQYADHVLFIKQGRTIAEGSVREVFTPATIEETFNHPVSLLNDKITGIPVVVPKCNIANHTVKINNHLNDQYHESIHH